jgi:hypothetical protein
MTLKTDRMLPRIMVEVIATETALKAVAQPASQTEVS